MATMSGITDLFVADLSVSGTLTWGCTTVQDPCPPEVQEIMARRYTRGTDLKPELEQILGLRTLAQVNGWIAEDGHRDCGTMRTCRGLDAPVFYMGVGQDERVRWLSILVDRVRRQGPDKVALLQFRGGEGSKIGHFEYVRMRRGGRDAKTALEWRQQVRRMKKQRRRVATGARAAGGAESAAAGAAAGAAAEAPARRGS